MSNPDNTKTIYLVIINRFSNVSKDLSTAVSYYEKQEQAEQHAKEILEDKDYITLRFAVSILPLTIITPQANIMNFSHPYGYIENKFGINLSAILPISPTSNDQDQK
jgi:hypothetical protein